jgi:hypothetical protein
VFHRWKTLKLKTEMDIPDPKTRRENKHVHDKGTIYSAKHIRQMEAIKATKDAKGQWQGHGKGSKKPKGS